MGKIKGTAMDEIRVMMRKQPGDKEKELKARLTPEELHAYETVLSISWFDLAILTGIVKKVSELLFPNDPECFNKMGVEASKHTLNTVYKIFMRILSVQQVFKQAAKIWKTYHDKGRAVLESVPDKPNETDFVVYDYPDMIKDYLPVMGGYIYGTLTIAGAKDIQVKIDVQNPSAWRFKITWK